MPQWESPSCGDERVPPEDCSSMHIMVHTMSHVPSGAQSFHENSLHMKPNPGRDKKKEISNILLVYRVVRNDELDVIHRLRFKVLFVSHGIG